MKHAALLQPLLSSAHRLYTLEGEGPVPDLAVEAWLGREAISELSEWRIVCVSANARIPLKSFMGQRVTLLTTLADGSQARRTGLVRLAEKLGADGSLARYRLTLVPWLWVTTQQRQSQVFQNRTLSDIIGQLLTPYAPLAAWRYDAAAEQRIAESGPRPHFAQYRETDYDFLARLLAEEGLGFTVVEDEGAPSGHAVLIFADSVRLAEDPSSAAGRGVLRGVRYHRAHSQEETDTIQQLISHTRTHVDGVAVSAWEPQSKRVLRGHAPTRYMGGAGCPDPYFTVSLSIVRDAAGARRLATQLMESIEARALMFSGQGTVRTLRSGTRLAVRDCPHLPPLEDEAAPYPILLDVVEHCGINNLPADTRAALADRLGPLDAALTFHQPPSSPQACLAPVDFTPPEEEEVPRTTPTAELLAAARAHGYGNRERGE